MSSTLTSPAVPILLSPCVEELLVYKSRSVLTCQVDVIYKAPNHKFVSEGLLTSPPVSELCERRSSCFSAACLGVDVTMTLSAMGNVFRQLQMATA